MVWELVRDVVNDLQMSSQQTGKVEQVELGAMSRDEISRVDIYLSGLL